MIPLADDVPRAHTPIVMWSLSALCVASFLFELSLPQGAIEPFLARWGLVPARLAGEGALFEAPALLTSIFLHGGWLHLLGNLWMLWIFGDNVEDRMGWWRFLTFFLACGVAAGAAHAVSNPSSTLPTLGASGAIAGVLGAYGVLYPHARVVLLVPILFYPMVFAAPAFLFIGLWLLIQVMSGALEAGSADLGGVAWWAHVGGLAAGIVLLPLFLHPRRRRAVYLDGYERSSFHDRMWTRLR